MRIEVAEAGERDRPTLENLLQFYLYDFTPFYEWDVGEDGRFGGGLLDGCWTEDYRHPFLVRVDGRLAGFAIVDRRSHFTGQDDVWDMGEFFVLRRYRGKGVGEHVARLLFDRFRGRWEVRELRKNEPAQAFWRAVIGRYTAGRFEEELRNDTLWRGPVQRFESSNATGPTQ